MGGSTPIGRTATCSKPRTLRRLSQQSAPTVGLRWGRTVVIIVDGIQCSPVPLISERLSSVGLLVVMLMSPLTQPPNRRHILSLLLTRSSSKHLLPTLLTAPRRKPPQARPELHTPHTAPPRVTALLSTHRSHSRDYQHRE